MNSEINFEVNFEMNFKVNFEWILSERIWGPKYCILQYFGHQILSLKINFVFHFFFTLKFISKFTSKFISGFISKFTWDFLPAPWRFAEWWRGAKLMLDLEWGMAGGGGRKKGKRWKNGVRTSAKTENEEERKGPGWMVQENGPPRKLPKWSPDLRPQVSARRGISRASKGKVV